MRTTSRLNSCSSKYRFSPRPSQRNRKARANQLELVVAMALASTSSLMALLPSNASWRTTRAGSCAPAGMAAAKSNVIATAAAPLTEAPWPGDEGRGGAEARLTACSKPGSLTTLRLHVNVRLPTGPAIRLLRRSLPSTLVLLTTACAVGDGPRGSGLQYYEGADPASLDPAVSSDVQSGEVVALLFDNLVQFDTEARLQPGLARRWESDRTGRVYTFHLRTGATFH